MQAEVLGRTLTNLGYSNSQLRNIYRCQEKVLRPPRGLSLLGTRGGGETCAIRFLAEAWEDVELVVAVGGAACCPALRPHLPPQPRLLRPQVFSQPGYSTQTEVFHLQIVSSLSQQVSGPWGCLASGGLLGAGLFWQRLELTGVFQPLHE
ncbi:type III endosome membrane protein TEMP isoform X1 [Equus przewalskii]|uniref:Type III endosome membrane protein TEMP isoform X1 n=1 Tax=Equus przewalskii TaxID=9798 RepID=A0ABM2F8G1_EQUPR